MGARPGERRRAKRIAIQSSGGWANRRRRRRRVRIHRDLHARRVRRDRLAQRRAHAVVSVPLLEVRSERRRTREGWTRAPRVAAVAAERRRWKARRRGAVHVEGWL